MAVAGGSSQRAESAPPAAARDRCRLPLRFGICGLGFMGRTHFDRLSNHPRARVVAVCDDDPQRREAGLVQGNLGRDRDPAATTALHSVRAYEDATRLIADPEVDAVVIALPTWQHADVAVAALEAGKHVLCEKPMALRVADCDRMIRAAKTSTRTLMVAHCIRFWPQYRAIRRLVAEGRIGTMKFALLRRISSPPTYSARNWILDQQQSGGALLDLHVHDVDFVHHAFGLPRTIAARGSRGPSGGFDHVVATYGYDDGRYIVLEGGWTYAAPWPFEMSITVCGDRGTLTWSSRGGPALRCFAEDIETSIDCPGDAYRNEDDYFVSCVLAGGAVVECLPNSTRISIGLVWLERRVIETGDPCAISDRLREHWSGAGYENERPQSAV